MEVKFNADRGGYGAFLLIPTVAICWTQRERFVIVAWLHADITFRLKD